MPLARAFFGSLSVTSGWMVTTVLSVLSGSTVSLIVREPALLVSFTARTSSFKSFAASLIAAPPRICISTSLIGLAIGGVLLQVTVKRCQCFMENGESHALFTVNPDFQSSSCSRGSPPLGGGEGHSHSTPPSGGPKAGG